MTVTPGFAVSKLLPISEKASVREAAAKTVRVLASGTSVPAGPVDAHPTGRSASSRNRDRVRFILYISLDCRLGTIRIAYSFGEYYSLDEYISCRLARQGFWS